MKEMKVNITEGESAVIVLSTSPVNFAFVVPAPATITADPTDTLRIYPVAEGQLDSLLDELLRDGDTVQLGTECEIKFQARKSHLEIE